MTLSNGRPTTLLMNRSSSPPNPTRSSASTSNASSPGFQLVSTTLDVVFEEDEEDEGERTSDELQKGMKDE